jgi:hypothetical protein
MRFVVNGLSGATRTSSRRKNATDKKQEGHCKHDMDQTLVILLPLPEESSRERDRETETTSQPNKSCERLFTAEAAKKIKLQWLLSSTTPTLGLLPLR